MLLNALSATAHDLAIGLAGAFFLAAVLYLLIRSNERLRKREDSRREEENEEVVPAFQWPPKPAEHPGAHESVVPQAGKRAWWD